METSVEMTSVLAWELQFFECAALTGLILRGCYDFLRAFRRLIKHNYAVVGIEDGLYCLAGAWLTFNMFLYENDGAVRLFALIGMAVGAMVYHFGPSEIVTKSLCRLIKIIFCPMTFLVKIFKKDVKSC